MQKEDTCINLAGKTEENAQTLEKRAYGQVEEKY